MLSSIGKAQVKALSVDLFFPTLISKFLPFLPSCHRYLQGPVLKALCPKHPSLHLHDLLSAFSLSLKPDFALLMFILRLDQCQAHTKYAIFIDPDY